MVIGTCHFPNIGGTRSYAGFFLRRIQPAEPGNTSPINIGGRTVLRFTPPG
jgi:hypothetical protein